MGLRVMEAVWSIIKFHFIVITADTMLVSCLCLPRGFLVVHLELGIDVRLFRKSKVVIKSRTDYRDHE